MKKYLTPIYASLLYFAVTMIIYLNYSHKPWFVSYDYETGYSINENIFWWIWILLSAFAVAIILKSERIREFLLKNFLFYPIYFMMGQDDLFLKIITCEILGDESFAYGVDFTRDTFFVYHYFGCILGTIAGLIITIIKKRKKEHHEN